MVSAVKTSAFSGTGMCIGRIVHMKYSYQLVLGVQKYPIDFSMS